MPLDTAWGTWVVMVGRCSAWAAAAAKKSVEAHNAAASCLKLATAEIFSICQSPDSANLASASLQTTKTEILTGEAVVAHLLMKLMFWRSESVDQIHALRASPAGDEVVSDYG